MERWNLMGNKLLKSLATKAVLLLITIPIVSCDTMRGVMSYSDDGFPRLSSKKCVENAIKNVSAVELLKIEKNNSSAQTIGLKKITYYTYTFFYKIRDKRINHKRPWSPYISIEEMRSESSHPDHNRVSYRNNYASIAGPVLSSEEKEITRPIIKELNDNIWQKCQLKIKQPAVE